MQRHGGLRRTPLKRTGPKHDVWKAFRNEKAAKERDEEGLLYCQDYKIGLERCHIGRPELDLHHIEGREARPDLYFDDNNLVWLTRECHDAAHNK